MKVKEKLIQEIEQTPAPLLIKTLDYLLLTKSKDSQKNAVEKSNIIWELAEEFIKNLPEDELDKIPIDGALQQDHYIYGTPKIEI